MQPLIRATVVMAHRFGCIPSMHLTHEMYIDADRVLRAGYEAYVGCKAGDTTVRMRNFAELVEWLARELFVRM